MSTATQVDWSQVHIDLPKDARFGIVASRFNEALVQKLMHGALQAFQEKGIDAKALHIWRVPGAWEIPLAAKKLAEKEKVAAIVALGAIIRGGTPHFEFVLDGLVAGLMQAMLETGVPIPSGVLSTNDEQQAAERAGGLHGNKGYDAAMSAMEMASLLKAP